MEKRIITIVSTANSSKVELETDAMTLGELKAAMNQADIAYDGMTFYEGLTKSELVDDASILPHDVVRNGQTTNNLVFMLTNTNKKIRSGYDRVELYTIIKAKGLAEECKERLGKNFTVCKTSELEELVKECESVKSAAEATTVETSAELKEIVKLQQEVKTLSNAFNTLLYFLTVYEIFNGDEIDEIKSCMVKGEENKDSIYKNSEIDDMFSFLNK